MGFYPDFVVISTTEDEKLGKKLVLAEHVLQFIPLNNLDEAHYVCAILNSSLVRENLKMLSSKSKSGLSSSIVSKIRLDKFNPKNNIHRKLADLSKKAHQLAEKGDYKTLKEVEREIDTIVENLYRLHTD